MKKKFEETSLGMGLVVSIIVLILVSGIGLMLSLMELCFLGCGIMGRPTIVSAGLLAFALVVYSCALRIYNMGAKDNK